MMTEDKMINQQKSWFFTLNYKTLLYKFLKAFYNKKKIDILSAFLFSCY